MSFPSPAQPTDSCCIYGHKNDGYTYLAGGLFTEAKCISLAAGQDAAAILAQIEPETRWFVWHVFFTYKQGIPRHRDALSHELKERGILTVNEDVTDGSKRHTQAVLTQLGLPTTIASPEGPPDELLFFKSNHNFGGIEERRSPASIREFFGVDLPHPSTPLFNDYQLAERRRFSRDAFENPDLFVERYIANRSDIFYRAFICFDAVVLSKLVCKGVIKKALEAEYREDYLLSFAEASTGFPSAPDELSKRIVSDVQRFCQAFKLDMGAVDILLDEQGVPHIIDANPTALGGENLDRPGFLEHLTKGLQDHAAGASRGAI